MMLLLLVLSFLSLGKLGLSESRLSSSVHACRFQTLSFLGTGSFGFVLKARLRDSNETFALKVYNSEKHKHDAFSEEWETLQSLGAKLANSEQRRSMALLSPEIQQPLFFNFKASLSPDECPPLSRARSLHDKIHRFAQNSLQHLTCTSNFQNVMTLHQQRQNDCFKKLLRLGDLKAMVFPLYKGGDLKVLLDRVQRGTRRLTDANIADLAMGIVRALQVLHSVGYVHLDLKPSNILLDSSNPLPDSNIGQPVLADFGIALPAGELATSRRGSFAYQAPETLEKEHHADFAEDIFAFGTVMKNLVSRRNLPSTHLVWLDEDIYEPPQEDIIGRCRSKKVHIRPSLDEIMESLQDLRKKGLSESHFAAHVEPYNL